MRGIDDLVDQIQQREEEKRAAADRIRTEAGSTLFQNGGTVEDSLLQDVNAAALDDLTVAGVDGGCARQAFHGIDVIMVRALAALFTYTDGTLDDATYHPDPSPTPRVEHVTRNLPRTAMDRLTTLHRLREEVEAAAAAAADADVVLLDGALLPQAQDRPGEGDLQDRYEAVLDHYRDLYGHDGLLVGVVEDTRNARICDVLQQNGFADAVLAETRDSALLDYVMEAGERTLLLPYADGDHPVAQDLDVADDVYTCYLKTTPKDRPIRLDIHAPGDPSATADRAAGIVHALAGGSTSYGIPAPLIEADQRAKLEQHEVELVTKRIESRLAHLSGTQSLRRDRRPF